MKRECPSLFAALLVSLLVNVLLRSQTAYWPRAGLFSAVVCAPLLAGVGWLFARSWRLAADPVYKLLFGALLVYTSVLELLRLWQLADRLYPGAVTLTSVCLLVVLPVVYLRRVSALSQTAYAVLCLLVLATVAMLASVLPRLCIVNLQTTALTQGDFLAAVRDQLTLYPEYLLPALWPEQDKRGRHTLLRLAAWALAFDVGMHLILELFYGAAMPLRIDPVHAAARCGALSIFNRLEWLQFILWVMAVTVKLALYLYALVRLLGGQNKAEDSAAGLDRFPLYPGGVWLLCAVLRKLDLDAALSLRNLTLSILGARREQIKRSINQQVLWYFLLPLILACISGAVGIYAMQLYLYSGAAHLEQSYPLLIAMAVIVVLVMVIYGVAVARTANREIGKLNYKPNS